MVAPRLTLHRLTIPLRRWLKGHMEPTGRPEIDGRIRAAQIHSTIRAAPVNLAANIITVAILIVALWPLSRTPGFLMWAIALWAFALRGIWRWHKGRKHWPRQEAGEDILIVTIVNAAFLGAMWGLLPATYFHLLSHSQELLVATIITGMIGAGAFAMSSLPLTSGAYVLAITTGSQIGLLRAGPEHLWPVAALLVVYSAIIIFAVQKTAKFFIERTLAEESVRERGAVIELLLREFQENGSDWLYELDRDLHIVRCSPRMCAVTGKTEKELANTFFPDLLCPNDRKEFLEHVGELSAFQDLACQVNLDDCKSWWSLTATPIRGTHGPLKGQVTGWRGVGSDITDAKRDKDRIVWMAQFDPLTGLYNRRRFREIADEALQVARHDGKPLALGCLDLDHFKEINDTLGHPVGDELLKRLAARLAPLSDGRVTIGRIGGDEFGVMIAAADSHGMVRKRLEAIIDAVSQPMEIDGNSIRPGGTIGVALSTDDAGTVDDMIRNADLALYAAKATSRGRIEFYHPDMHREAEEKRGLREDLRSALANGELRLQYQPIIDIAAGRIAGFEALLRWAHPRLGMLSPDRFIEIAETAGLIEPIGNWVLDTACRDAMSWPDDIGVSVNVSPAQFYGSCLAAEVEAALERSGLPAWRLEIEITEAVFVHREMSAEKFIGEMNKLGVGIALDDFGTGYSSFAYLTRFAVQKLKIDRSFVSGQRAFKERNAIVSAMVGIARTLNMNTTAEGVETAAELAWVTGLGCRQVQGYYFARPMNVEEVGPYIESFDLPSEPAKPTKAAASA